ncbi:hypothetical protein CCR94_15675 [Rhodoblastus sphagnicola]|uniref:Uncharacterized protein n=1 Tax=Rhodoblastus sphagnicola TaxID=333368 RepID=A0A2S6N3P9_9HYPH|nr:hypothetical protein CCR94_15675 [Rhodoblastus sphagnicola]
MSWRRKADPQANVVQSPAQDKTPAGIPAGVRLRDAARLARDEKGARTRPSISVVIEQGDDDDHWNWHAQQPEQNSASHV